MKKKKKEQLKMFMGAQKILLRKARLFSRAAEKYLSQIDKLLTAHSKIQTKVFNLIRNWMEIMAKKKNVYFVEIPIGAGVGPCRPGEVFQGSTPELQFAPCDGYWYGPDGKGGYECMFIPITVG